MTDIGTLGTTCITGLFWNFSNT